MALPKIKQCNDDCVFTYHEKSHYRHKYCTQFNRATAAVFEQGMKNLCCYASDFVPVEKNSLFLLHQNMRSLNKNVEGLEAYLHHISTKGRALPSIIGVTETWLTSLEQGQLKRVQLNEYKFIHNYRKTGKGGGVGFLYIAMLSILNVKTLTSYTLKICG